jgi:hypothetical protein
MPLTASGHPAGERSDRAGWPTLTGFSIGWPCCLPALRRSGEASRGVRIPDDLAGFGTALDGDRETCGDSQLALKLITVSVWGSTAPQGGGGPRKGKEGAPGFGLIGSRGEGVDQAVGQDDKTAQPRCGSCDSGCRRAKAANRSRWWSSREPKRTSIRFSSVS